MNSARWYLACVVALTGWTGFAPGGGKGADVTLDGLKSRTPANWIQEAPKLKTRLAQFRVPKAANDPQDGEVTIAYFGAGGGGGLADNIERWKSMVIPPKGKNVDDIFKKETLKVGDVTLTMVDMEGTYKGAPFEKIEPRPNYRMIRVHFASKNGPYYIGFVGPARTVGENRQAFMDWLKGFK